MVFSCTFLLGHTKKCVSVSSPIWACCKGGFCHVVCVYVGRGCIALGSNHASTPVLGESRESSRLGTSNEAVGEVALGVHIVRGTTLVWDAYNVHGLHAKSTPPQRRGTWYKQ